VITERSEGSQFCSVPLIYVIP